MDKNQTPLVIFSNIIHTMGLVWSNNSDVNNQQSEKENMKKDYAFIDLQGFKDNFNRFIIKEFAIITKNLKFHDIIKSPKNVTLDIEHRKQAKWLTEEYHGIDWESGYISLKELRNTLQPILHGKVIYVKGREKTKWIQDILEINNNTNTINDLETIGCKLNINKMDSNIQDKFRACKKHTNLQYKKNRKTHCAMQNVMILPR